MRKLILVLIAFLAVLALLLFYHPQATHYHAGFIVYVNGQKQDFSDFKYMDLIPCTTNAKEPSNPQLEKAHLHDGVGDVVHVEAPAATWGDLFHNLNFQFPAGETVVGYVNGQSVADFLKQPILPDESVIVVAGPTDHINLNTYVSLDHIKEIGLRSESCSSNN